MKTPEEIKRGLERCNDGECTGCPYQVTVDCPFGDEMGCNDELLTDAIAYIKKLESTCSQAEKALRGNGFKDLEELLETYDRVKCELEFILAPILKMAKEHA